jgi:hypothetical protein
VQTDDWNDAVMVCSTMLLKMSLSYRAGAWKSIGAQKQKTPLAV